jgi:hypothetical protein
MAFAKRRPTHLHITMPEHMSSAEKCNKNTAQHSIKQKGNTDGNTDDPKHVATEVVSRKKKVTFAISISPERKPKRSKRPPSPHPKKRTGYMNTDRNPRKKDY